MAEVLKSTERMTARTPRAGQSAEFWKLLKEKDKIERKQETKAVARIDPKRLDELLSGLRDPILGKQQDVINAFKKNVLLKVHEFHPEDAKEILFVALDKIKSWDTGLFDYVLEVIKKLDDNEKRLKLFVAALNSLSRYRKLDVITNVIIETVGNEESVLRKGAIVLLTNSVYDDEVMRNLRVVYEFLSEAERINFFKHVAQTKESKTLACFSADICRFPREVRAEIAVIAVASRPNNASWVVANVVNKDDKVRVWAGIMERFKGQSEQLPFPAFEILNNLKYMPKIHHDFLVNLVTEQLISNAQKQEKCVTFHGTMDQLPVENQLRVISKGLGQLPSDSSELYLTQLLFSIPSKRIPEELLTLAALHLEWLLRNGSEQLSAVELLIDLDKKYQTKKMWKRAYNIAITSFVKENGAREKAIPLMHLFPREYHLKLFRAILFWDKNINTILEAINNFPNDEQAKLVEIAINSSDLASINALRYFFERMKSKNKTPHLLDVAMARIRTFAAPLIFTNYDGEWAARLLEYIKPGQRTELVCDIANSIDLRAAKVAVDIMLGMNEKERTESMWQAASLGAARASRLLHKVGDPAFVLEYIKKLPMRHRGVPLNEFVKHNPNFSDALVLFKEIPEQEQLIKTWKIAAKKLKKEISGFSEGSIVTNIQLFPQVFREELLNSALTHKSGIKSSKGLELFLNLPEDEKTERLWLGAVKAASNISSSLFVKTAPANSVALLRQVAKEFPDNYLSMVNPRVSKETGELM